jgi:hypothetical protein
MSVPRDGPVPNLWQIIGRGRIEHMSDTCACPSCGRPPTEDVDHTEAAPDAPFSREDNLTPVSRHREVVASR